MNGAAPRSGTGEFIGRPWTDWRFVRKGGSGEELALHAGHALAPHVDVAALDPHSDFAVARLEDEPHVNPSTGTKEFSLRDPDGYYVTLSALAVA